MCEHSHNLAIAVALVIAIWLVWKIGMAGELFGTGTDVLNINGVKIPVERAPYGVYTSGADLRDQVAFSSTDQGTGSTL